MLEACSPSDNSVALTVDMLIEPNGKKKSLLSQCLTVQDGFDLFSLFGSYSLRRSVSLNAGEISMVCAGDQVHAQNDLVFWGLSVPQSSIAPETLNKAANDIAQACKQRGDRTAESS